MTTIKMDRKYWVFIISLQNIETLLRLFIKIEDIKGKGIHRYARFFLKNCAKKWNVFLKILDEFIDQNQSHKKTNLQKYCNSVVFLLKLAGPTFLNSCKVKSNKYTEIRKQ